MSNTSHETNRQANSYEGLALPGIIFVIELSLIKFMFQ